MAGFTMNEMYWRIVNQHITMNEMYWRIVNQHIFSLSDVPTFQRYCLARAFAHKKYLGSNVVRYVCHSVR